MGWDEVDFINLACIYNSCILLFSFRFVLFLLLWCMADGWMGVELGWRY